MKQLRFAILQGLARERKDIIQILTDAGITPSKRQLTVAMQHLETLGLIRRHAETEHAAELTTFGREVLVAVR